MTRKSLRSQSIARAPARPRGRGRPEVRRRTARLAWVEIHKGSRSRSPAWRFAIIGIPLAESARRGGRGSAFAISLAIIVLYYVLSLVGRDLGAARAGCPPESRSGLHMPSLVLAGTIAIARSGARAGPLAFLPVRASAGNGAPSPPSARARGLRASFGFREFSTATCSTRFVGMLLLVAASVPDPRRSIVDYAEHVDKIAKNHPPTSVVLGYYRCLSRSRSACRLRRSWR